MKPRIEIRIFGRFSFRCEERDLLLHTSAKAKEILSYLIVNRRMAIRRECLATLISADAVPDRCRKAFRHALWQLRSDLTREQSAGADRVLRIEEEWIQFIPDDAV